MKSLQDAVRELETIGVRVQGISRDSVADQSKFAEECSLEMPLLSDPDGSATDKYDVAYEGRPYSQRVTFVIDPMGVIRMRDTEVSVKSHGADLLQAVKRLQAK